MTNARSPRDTETPQDAMALSAHRLGFSVTKACPLSCAHCSVSASPAPELAKTTFTSEFGDHVAAQMSELAAADITYIDFTGGEPTLASAFVRKVSEAASDCGISSGIVTAAHWAKTQRQAERYVEKFRHISSWDISTDVYHLPFVDLDTVERAYELLSHHGKSVRIRIAYHEPMTLEDAQIIDRVHKFAGDNLGFQPISPVGRGGSIGISIRKSKRDFSTGACPTTGPLIRPSGSVEACCAPLSHTEAEHPLRFGNAFEDRLVDVVHRWRTNPLLQTIRLWGFGPVFEWLESEQHELERVYNSRACLQCVDLLKDPVLAQAAMKYASSLRQRIILATTLLEELNEPWMDNLLRAQARATLERKAG